MKMIFPPTADLEEIRAELNKLQDTPERRVLAAQFPDGSYRVIGNVVKDPDCPQEDFDFAMDQLSKIYDR